MEGRRLSIHAGAPRRQEVKLGLVALLAIVLASPLAGAVPKDGKARAAFDQGIAAYQKSDWAAAAEAFSRSYSIEADVETLFAWAQAERQQEHCDKAIELYNKLLESKLPDENKQVVSEKLGHSPITLTIDTYSHLVPVLHERAAAAMDALLQRVGVR